MDREGRGKGDETGLRGKMRGKRGNERMEIGKKGEHRKEREEGSKKRAGERDKGRARKKRECWAWGWGGHTCNLRTENPEEGRSLRVPISVVYIHIGAI